MKSKIKKLALLFSRGISSITPDFIKNIYLILQDIEIRNIKNEIFKSTPDDLSLRGYKTFSQNEEDGIISEIFKRIPSQKNFIEIGTGNGKECNTLNLLMNHWKGVWIDGSLKAIKTITETLGGADFDKLKIVNALVKVDTVTQLITSCTDFLNTKKIDFISIDIDGNDYFIVEKLFEEEIFPSVVCVEYNAKFRVDLKLNVQYNPQHLWDKTDYMGCSLSSWDELFNNNGYTLLCCTITGVNAFYIRDNFREKFTIYDTAKLYRPAKYHLSATVSGHPTSLTYLKNLLKK